ncbi:MAG: glycine cleavage system aminomethyltransferase GcvT, partial [Methanobacteriota archaeon]
QEGRSALFDASHMGEFSLTGLEAEGFLDHMLTNRISGSKPGKCVYSPMCYENGGTVDDLIVFRKSDESFMIVVNASNTSKDWDWLRGHAKPGLDFNDLSGGTALLAVQGDTSLDILQSLSDTDLADMKFMSFRDNVDVAGVPTLVSRTGYTGADGFEIYCDWDRSPLLWQALMYAGKARGITLAGLAARDVVRIEAGLPLYGHELGENISPLDAGLGRFVKLGKKDFVGARALSMRANPQALMGLTHQRGVPEREDGSVGVICEGVEVGYVSSSCYSPNLDSRISMAFFRDPEDATPFTEVMLSGKDGRQVPAEITALPFIRKEYKK